MTATSKTKSHPKEVPFKIYAKRFHINNQQMCIDCLKPRSNKNERGCKKCGCDHFYVPNYQSFLFVVLPKSIILQCIKMVVLSKIKSHSDAVDYFKERPFYDKPIEKRLKSIDQLAELPFYEQLV